MKRIVGWMGLLLGTAGFVGTGAIAAVSPLVVPDGSLPTQMLGSLEPAELLAQFGRERPDFFERGDDRLEDEIRRLETGKPASGLLSIQGEQLQWQQVVSKQGGFAVWMPATAIAEAQETLTTSVGTLELNAMTTEPGAAKFVAAYAKRPVGDETVVLDAVCDGIAQEASPLASRDRTIAFQGHPGRELIFQGNDETIAIRVYLTPQRLYVLGVLQPQATSPAENTPLSKAAIAFFNSFRLLR